MSSVFRRFSPPKRRYEWITNTRLEWREYSTSFASLSLISNLVLDACSLQIISNLAGYRKKFSGFFTVH